MEEVWRQSNDMKDYEISSEGRIKNSKTGRIMKTNIDKKGYEQVTLRDQKRACTRRVHKLVADAFHPGDHEGLEVTHLDRNRLNNRADNLAWKTRSEIIQQTYKDGRKQSHKMKKIMCVETGVIYDSIVDCSRDMGLTRQAISKSANNPVLSTKDGYHFEFID